MPQKKAKPPKEHFQNYRQEIGDSIRMFREENELSQEDLADLMEVQRSTISKIENGKFAVSIDYIVKFGWYLDFEFVMTKKKGK